MIKKIVAAPFLALGLLSYFIGFTIIWGNANSHYMLDGMGDTLNAIKSKL